jgi:hypothetical protein
LSAEVFSGEEMRTMLDRGEVGAVVVLLEGLAAQRPGDPLSVLAARVAAALYGRMASGDGPLETSLDVDLGPDSGSAAVAAAERRREIGQTRDLAADARDEAAEGRDERAAIRAAQAVESARTAEATAARMSELLRLAELRDDRAAERTPEQQRHADEEDRASNRVDRAALRAFLLALRVDRAAERQARHADAQNRFAARRDRLAARADREVAQDDRDQTLIEVEALADQLRWTRENIIGIIEIIERAEALHLTDLKIDPDPTLLDELQAIAREAEQYRAR